MSERRITSTDQLGLELVYEANKVELFDENAQQIGETVYLHNKQRMGTLERTAEVYLQLGPGLHTIDADSVSPDRERSLKSAAKLLPNEALRYGTIEDVGCEESSRFVYFGNLAIRGRMADTEEIEQTRREAKEYRDIQEQKRRDEIRARDAEKDDYSEFDHAFIKTDDSAFFMNLDLPQSILAYRTLAYLQKLNTGDMFYWNELDKSLWQAMPTTERMRLGLKEAEVYSNTERPILQITAGIIRELAVPLGLVTTSHQRTEKPLELELHAIPNPDNYSGDALPIVPPGTPKRVLDSLRDPSAYMPEEVLEELSRQLNELIQSPSWQPEDAVDALNIIMSLEGKVTLFKMHTKEGRDVAEQHAQSEDMLDTLHKRVYRTLGHISYHSARQQRTIGGNRAYDTKNPSVKQTSGGSSAEATKKEEQLKRWAIGKPQTLKNRYSL
jgi:hypothetical protein